MSEKKQSITDLKPFQSAALLLEAELKQRGNSPELPLKSMPDLSYKLCGIHKRKLMVIGARTSNGKTVMAVNIAWDLAKQKKNVMFLSLEMPIERITERIFCLETYTDNLELLKNGYNKDEKIRGKFKDFLANSPKNFILSDCIGKDWNFFDKILGEMGGKPDVVIIDHIQEIRGSVSQKQAIDEHISKMRESAIRNNFALIICSQVNRIAPADKEDREPQLHHLKATGFLEEAADQVILLHWPWHYDNSKPKNDLIVNVAKNRDGMTGRVKMFFKPENYQIYDIAGSVSEECIKKEEVNWNE